MVQRHSPPTLARRQVSDEMQVRLPAQTAHTKMRDRGGIGGQVFCVRAF